jgi:hypothetical protein
MINVRNLFVGKGIIYFRCGGDCCAFFNQRLRNIKEKSPIFAKKIKTSLIMKSFEQWESEEIEITFGVKRLKNSPEIQQWISAKCDIDPHLKKILISLQNRLAEKAEYWNEDELKFFFISPILSFIDFMGEKYNTFTQRPLSAQKNDVNGNAIALKGRVEFIVAAGKQHPRHPYFCLHEYKPEKRRDADPLGQLLAAMIAAQTNNKANHPIYGCYVIERMWFFVILDNNSYSVSRSFDATNDDIFDIYCILLQCKKYIEVLVVK